MSLAQIFLLVVLSVVVLPVLSYLVVKFGRAGYLNARGRDKQNQSNEENK
jgi:hypothetical protein